MIVNSIQMITANRAGLAELRAMMTDRRFADPKKFQHIRQELGIDPTPKQTPEMLDAFVKAELTKWTPIAKASGLQLD